MKNEGNKTFIKVTQQMIYDKLVALEEKTHAIHEQTIRTNGRVTHLEDTSWGLWVEKHPYKFAGVIVSLVLIILTVDGLKDKVVSLLHSII